MKNRKENAKEFIKNMYSYLKQGKNWYIEDSEEKPVPLSDSEVKEIMLDNDSFINDVDVFNDELSYYKLDENDVINLTEKELDKILAL